MRYPVHRSLVFWGGLLVMGFIVWSWWDSTGCITRAWGWGVVVDVRDSGVVVKQDPYSLAKPLAQRMEMRSGGRPWVMRLGRPGFVRWKNYPEAHHLYVDKALDQELRAHLKVAVEQHWFSYGGGRPDGWACFIPYWLVLLAVAVMWAGLLGWRVRRWRKGEKEENIEHRTSNIEHRSG